jgi:hypothetical protein
MQISGRQPSDRLGGFHDGVIAVFKGEILMSQQGRDEERRPEALVKLVG